MGLTIIQFFIVGLIIIIGPNRILSAIKSLIKFDIDTKKSHHSVVSRKSIDEAEHQGFSNGNVEIVSRPKPFSYRRLSSMLLFFISLALYVGYASYGDKGLDVKCVIQLMVDRYNNQRSGWSCLHYASTGDDLGRLSRMISNGANLEARSSAGRTPLYDAAKHGKLDALKLLQKSGANLIARDDHIGYTSLHVSSEYKHPNVVKYLLSQGVDVNIRNRWDQTPLWQASWRKWNLGDVIIPILVRSGADINAQSRKGSSSLHSATKYGKMTMVKYLLNAGANINIKTKQGSTPLMFAARHNQIETVQYLLEKGAEVVKDTKKWSALKYAKNNDNRDMELLLLRHGAIDVDTHLAYDHQKAGYDLYKSNKFDKAILEFTKAILENKFDERSYYYRGNVFFKKGNFNAAVEDLRHSIELNPKNTKSLEILAWIYLKQGKMEQSRGIYTRLIKADPTNGKAYHNRAGINKYLGNNAIALDDVRKACEKGYADGCMMYKKLSL